MQRVLLKSKIHRATVTDANLEYEGSVTIDPLLMEATDIVEWEQVDVYDITNGSRLSLFLASAIAARSLTTGDQLPSAWSRSSGVSAS